MTKLYILSGLPFSGKSSIAREVEAKSKVNVVSFDDIWNDSAKINPNISYDLVRADCENKIEDLLRGGVSVMYDSTNLSLNHRLELSKLANRAGAESIVVYLPLTPEIIRERRARSLIDNSHHIVSDENFESAFDRLEPPVDCIVLVTEDDKSKFINSLN